MSLSLRSLFIGVSVFSFAQGQCPFGGNELRRALLESATSGSSTCEDILASSPSPIKECSELIKSFPCGSNAFGTDVNELCKKTCGLCGGDDDGDTDNSSSLEASGNGNATVGTDTGTVQMIPDFDPNQISFFEVDADLVEVTTLVPMDTDWFGYIFYTTRLVAGDSK